mgnify:CR=1 FL=1
MIKRIIAVETNTYPPPNLTGVSTELNLSHMLPPLRHLRGTGPYLTAVLWTRAPTKKKKKKKTVVMC